jgi:glycosyltransferase involved in cell wall biosynthesis
MADPETGREVWFFVSELEWLRAGSFRQERWVRLFFQWNPVVTIFNVMGAFHLTVARFETDEDFTRFRTQSLAKAPLVASVREGWFACLLRKFKHLFLVDLYLPNCFLLLARAWWRLARAEGSVFLMCSSPPFSLALIGGLLKLCFPRKVVLHVDMRDAWALHPALGGIPALKRALERRVFRASDHLTTISNQLAQELTATYGFPVRTLYNVATHYFPKADAPPMALEPLDLRLKPGTLKLVYTGSTPVGFYDGDALARGTRRYLDRHPGEPLRIQFLFLGACAEIQKAVMKVPGLEDVFIFSPTVSHGMAKAIQVAADALVFLGFLGQGNKGIITTKFFEYLALGKPIFPVSVHPGSDPDLLLQRFAGGGLNLRKEEEIAGALERLHAQGTSFLPRCADPGPLEALYEDYIAFAAALFGEERRC